MKAFSLENILDILKKYKIFSAALVAGDNNNLFKFDLNKPLAIVVGSEGKGVRKNIQKLCDFSLSIPQFGRVNSLNASVSTAITLFEIIRQRNYK